MEKSPVSPAVEHTGSQKGHSMLEPGGTDEKKPVRRRPPRTLQLNMKTPGDQAAGAKPSSGVPRVRPKSSPLIEKLQASLALSPTALFPSPKSPDVNHPPSPFSACPTHSSLAPPSPALFGEEETPVSFEAPPEGDVLPSINKGRARLSFKRRPPTRQLRKSSSEDAGAAGGRSSPCQQDGQQQDEEEEDDAFERTERKAGSVRGRKSAGRDGRQGELEQNTMLSQEQQRTNGKPRLLHRK
ncbi:hypothetical protein GJAV_G00057490 [Gymnothorax javanicus]|nr:hypothetical protein GJAV_G00057490 [Gymnothorax javanicus]